LLRTDHWFSSARFRMGSFSLALPERVRGGGERKGSGFFFFVTKTTPPALRVAGRSKGRSRAMDTYAIRDRSKDRPTCWSKECWPWARPVGTQNRTARANLVSKKTLSREINLFCFVGPKYVFGFGDHWKGSEPSPPLAESVAQGASTVTIVVLWDGRFKSPTAWTGEERLRGGTRHEGEDTRAVRPED